MDMVTGTDIVIATAKRINRNLHKHLHAYGNQDNPGDNLRDFRFESLGGVAPDFKTENAHHKACNCNGGGGKNHVGIQECERNPDRECVNACGDRQ